MLNLNCSRDFNIDFRLQNLTNAEADFNLFWQLRNKLVSAAENISREENLSPVLLTTMSKDMVEHLKLSYKLVDVVDGANRKICVTLLRQIVDEQESRYAPVRFFAKTTQEEKFQQIVYVKNKLKDFIYLLDGQFSLYNEEFTIQINFNVL